jgi:hypothetical protein
MDSRPMADGSRVNDTPDFLERVKRVMSHIGMVCLVHTQHSLFFIHPTTHCKVTYYINAVFPKALEYCYVPCTILVVCGLGRSRCPPQLMSKWTHIICDNKTTDGELVSDWAHATISTIVWDTVKDGDINTREFIIRHTQVV